MTPVGPYQHTSYRGSRRRPWLAILLLLVVAGGLVAVLTDYSPARLFGASRAAIEKDFARAARLSSQGHHVLAAGIYERVSADDDVAPDQRAQAEVMLARIYREHLNNPGAAALAEERARRLAQQAGNINLPGEESATRKLSMAEWARRAEVDLRQPEGEVNVIATLGDQTVSLEEVLFAWQFFNGNLPPRGEDFRDFVNSYLDLVLLADEAVRRELNLRNRFYYDMRIQRLTTLNRLLQFELGREIAAPSPEELADFADRLSLALSEPASVTVGLIVVDSERAADRLADALEDDDADFARLAADYSLAHNDLEQGYIAGSITERDQELPRFGRNPRLVQRLTAMEAGATTGPLRSAQGWFFFKVLARNAGRPVRVDVSEPGLLERYQQHIIAERRAELLRQLQEERPIEVFADRLQAMVDGGTTQTLATTPTLSLDPTGAPAPADDASAPPDNESAESE
ncbi:MAG: Chaperone SurA [candidate division BRC1 bacterium ADurb.BinA292]|nr:MAG: Chaperone SurA [candidate division BRC1 bacterium ADurb.BinA292]